MLKTLAKDYSILFFVRIASRVIDFFLKIFVIRAIDPNIFATTVHFQLIMNVALFYTKTCLKNSYQKRAEGLSDRQMAISASNLMLLGVPICFVVAVGMVAAAGLFVQVQVSYFLAAAALHGVAAVVQSLQESFVAKLVLEMKYDRIGRNELASLVSKSLVLWVGMLMGWFHVYGVLVFGVSQLVYSLVLALLTYLETDYRSYAMERLTDGQLVHDNMKNSAKEFSLISIVKLILQELEKFVLVAFNISIVSSDFSLISKLGSIIPKYAFAPLEEIGFNMFSKVRQQEENRVTLQTLFRILIILGLLIIVFGVCYSRAVLVLLVGEDWATTSAVNSFRVYCVYILFMGLNGISQAFVYARIKTDKMAVFRGSMVVTTIVYLVCCVTFVQVGLGAAGIFLSSTISMACRICVCWKVYIHKEVFGGVSTAAAVLSLLPKPQVILLYMGSMALCWNIRNIASYQLLNLFIGGVVFLLSVGVTVYFQRDILTSLKNIRQASAAIDKQN